MIVTLVHLLVHAGVWPACGTVGDCCMWMHAWVCAGAFNAGVCVCVGGGGVRVCAALLNITATVALMHTLYHLYHSDNSHTMVDQQKIKTWHIDVACAQSFATPRISC